MRFIIIYVMLIGGASGAETALKVEMPPGYEFPKDAHHNNTNQGERYVYVAHEGYELKTLPGGSDFSGYKCKFMQPFIWHYEHQPKAGPSCYLLSQRENNKLVPYGWIEASRCCCTDGPYCLSDKINQIQRKAFLVNKVEAIKPDADLTGVRPSLVPEIPVDGHFSEKILLSNVMFIYAEFQADKNSEKHYLLGNEPDFVEKCSKPDLIRNTVLGWVPANRIFLWNTREALEIHRDNTLVGSHKRRTIPVKVFDTIDNAKDYHNNPKKAVKVLFEECFDKLGVSPLVPPFRMRFPRAPLDSGVYDAIKGGTLYKVGCVGPVVDPKDPEKVILTVESYTDLQQRLNEIKQQLAITEILFIIDGTSSMEPGFEKASKVIQDIILKVQNQKGVRVNIGIAIYTDLNEADELKWRGNKDKDEKGVMYTDWRKDDEWVAKLDKTVEVWPMRDAKLKEAHLDKLNTYKPTGGGAPPEQVFHGLQQGIARAGFSDYSRKLVVAVGDMGDHREDKEQKESMLVVDALLAQQNGVKQFKRSPSPMEFYALHSHLDPESSEDSKNYRRQMQTICELYNRKVHNQKLNLPHAKLYAMNDSDFATDICKRYEVLQKQSDGLVEEIKRVQNGQFNELKSGDMLMDILNRAKVDIKTVQSGIQIFSEGYVFEKHEGKQQVKMKYLMNEKEIGKLISTLRPIIIDYDREVKNGRINPGKVLVDAFTGDNPEKESMNKQKDDTNDVKKDGENETIVKKAQGLAIRSPLLIRLINNINNVRRQCGREDLQEIEDMRRRLSNLEAALNDEVIPWDEKPEIIKVPPTEINRWVAKGEKQKISQSRKFRLPGAGPDSTQWIWIDYEEEIP